MDQYLIILALRCPSKDVKGDWSLQIEAYMGLVLHPIEAKLTFLLGFFLT